MLISIKTLVQTALLTTLLCVNLYKVNAQTHPDFTGSWVADTLKIVPADIPKYTYPNKLIVKQTTDSVLFKFLSIDAENKEYAFSENVKLDGKENEMIARDKKIKKVSIRWSSDGLTMLKDAVFYSPDDPGQPGYGNLQKWAFINGGKSLVVESTFQSAAGSYTIKLIYNRLSKDL